MVECQALHRITFVANMQWTGPKNVTFSIFNNFSSWLSSFQVEPLHHAFF